MRSITEKAYAKINIGLDVLGRRPDGYHELKMVMQTVGIYDDVLLEETEEEGIRILCDTPGVPCDRRNLAYRAAEAMFTYLRTGAEGQRTGAEGRKPGICIRLVKRIPAAAGLAGGSSDAAAVLRGMSRMFAPGLSGETLRRIALPLGADVPYCVSGGTALAEGIGEKLTFLPALPECGIVVVKPEFDCSTAEIYGNLHVERISREAHPDMDRVIGAIRRGDIGAAARSMGNLLEIPALQLHPEIRTIKEQLLEAGADGTSMSGSGSAVFGMFTDPRQAEACPRLLRERGTTGQVMVTAPAAGEAL